MLMCEVLRNTRVGHREAAGYMGLEPGKEISAEGEDLGVANLETKVKPRGK